MTDAGLKHLRTMKKLEELRLENTRVTNAGEERLRWELNQDLAEVANRPLIGDRNNSGAPRIGAASQCQTWCGRVKVFGLQWVYSPGNWVAPAGGRETGGRKLGRN